MKTAILSIFLFTAGCGAAADPIKPVAGEWSATVNGLRARILIREEPVSSEAVIYLELQNVSDVLSPLEIYFHTTPAPLRCELLDAAGKPVPQTPAPSDILAPLPYWLALPSDSTLRLRVSVNGYGIPDQGGRPLQLESGFWMIPNSPASDLFLSATFNAANAKERPRDHAWEGTLHLPKLKVATKAK